MVQVKVGDGDDIHHIIYAICHGARFIHQNSFDKKKKKIEYSHCIPTFNRYCIFMNRIRDFL